MRRRITCEVKWRITCEYFVFFLVLRVFRMLFIFYPSMCMFVCFVFPREERSIVLGKRAIQFMA
jgi:hypothetical protein